MIFREPGKETENPVRELAALRNRKYKLMKICLNELL